MCLVYKILKQSIGIQGYSIADPYNGLLAELSTILDSFSPVPQAITEGWLVEGGGEPQIDKENTHCAVDLLISVMEIMDPLMLEMT